MFLALSYQRKGRVDVRESGAHGSHPRLADNDLAIVRLHVLVHVLLQLRRDGGARRDQVLADLGGQRNDGFNECEWGKYAKDAKKKNEHNIQISRATNIFENTKILSL
jgi:hypothetical protein